MQRCMHKPSSFRFPSYVLQGGLPVKTGRSQSIEMVIGNQSIQSIGIDWYRLPIKIESHKKNLLLIVIDSLAKSITINNPI